VLTYAKYIGLRELLHEPEPESGNWESIVKWLQLGMAMVQAGAHAALKDFG
jgi:hypothetical protein